MADEHLIPSGLQCLSCQSVLPLAVRAVSQKAKQAADETASVVSKGAMLAFAAMLLGAIAGWFGGRSGVVHPVFADRIIPARARPELRDEPITPAPRGKGPAAKM